MQQRYGIGKVLGNSFREPTKYQASLIVQTCRARFKRGGQRRKNAAEISNEFVRVIKRQINQSIKHVVDEIEIEKGAAGKR